MSPKKAPTVAAQDRRARHHLSTDLNSNRLLARKPIIGLILFIFGVLAFAGLVYNLQNNGPLLKWDTALSVSLPAIALKSPPIVKPLMDAGFYIGDQVMVGIAILLILYFIIKHQWREITMIAVGLPGSSLLFTLLTNYFLRTRPPTQIWIIVNLPGFPSGHALSSLTFYGLLAYLLASRIRSGFWKGVVITAAILLVGYIGFSRVFTGGHYLTDILAGYAVGIAWSALAFTLIELIFKKRKKQNDNKE